MSPLPGIPLVRPRVPLVEDGRELSTLLAELLTEEGYQVDIARTGNESCTWGWPGDTRS